MQLSKKSLIAIILGAVLIIAVILYFILARQQPTPSQTSQIESSRLLNSALSELGTPSDKEQLNIRTDNNISASGIKNTKTRSKLVDEYGLTPELLLSTKNFINNYPSQTGGGEIYNNAQLDFNFILSPSAEQAVQSEESKKINGQVVPIYEFETNIDDKFLSNLARSFAIEEKAKETDPATGEIIISNFNPNQPPKDIELKTLLVNPLTGSFVYYASGLNSKEEGQDVIKKAQNYLLNNSGLSAYTKNLDFSQTATYERKDVQGIKFIEFHRGWRPLPILNSISIFNLQKLGKNIEDTIKDPLNRSSLVEDTNIINTSNGLNGFARTNDFNTITLGIATNGVITVSGKMRPLKNDAGKLSLISPATAYDNVKNGQSYQSMVVTTGEGTADPKKVFPNDIAKSDSAVIDTIYLSYLEEPEDKKENYLQPVYIMRGSAKLDSGYNVVFTIVTPAYEKSVRTSSLLEVSADVESENIKIDFVKIKVEQTQPQTGVKPAAGEAVPAVEGAQAIGPSQYDNMQAEQIPESESCYKKFHDFRTINGMILGRTRTNPNYSLTGRIIYRFTPQTQISVVKGNNIALAQTGKQQITSTVWKYAETIGKAGSQDIGSFIHSDGGVGSSCVTCNLGSTPCTGRYYSGVSPLVYLYGSGQNFTLAPQSTGEITYSDPPLYSQWIISASQNPKSYYYEFTYKNINIPSTGFVIQKDLTMDFLKDFLLPRLNLTNREIEDYLVDIQTHIISQTLENKKYYKISLIDSAEIERVLPFEVNPKPQQQIRNFLHFKSLDKPELTELPELPAKINRSQSNSLLVENGCLLDENGKQN